MNGLVPGGRTGTVMIAVLATLVVHGMLRKSALKETDPAKRKDTIAGKLGLVE